MRKKILNIQFGLVIIILVASCQNNKTEEKIEKSLTERENQLLKRENELLKKEKDLYFEEKNKIEKEPKKNLEITQNNEKVNNLNYLKKYNGKSPYDVNLLKSKNLKERMKNLLKSRYNFVIEKWAVENPIEIKNNTFIASGCEQHNCGFTNFIIVVDLLKDILYVGVKEEGEIKVYSENNETNEEIIKWENEN